MSAYEEIMLALRFFFGVEEDENVNEIIGQDHDPISMWRAKGRRSLSTRTALLESMVSPV